MPERSPLVSTVPATPEIVVVGAPRTAVRDMYHLFLRIGWHGAIAAIIAFYFALNAVFACAYLASGGVASMRARSFFDALCFSVQTMGTIGYGDMHPTSALANVIVMAESVTSLIVTALATGLIFAKFSRFTARIAFSRQVVIGPMDGTPTLMLRIGNERANQILEATIRVAIIRTERLKEGTIFYRMHDLQLARERSPALSRSWTVLHSVTDGSPLYGATPGSLVADDVELLVTVVGVDDTSLQPVHARKRYVASDVIWGARYADILTDDPRGGLVVDLTKFHDVVSTEPIEGFPYPARGAVS
ncbi:MAG: ion channel [Myxococcota bacterium]|nr:ion channel [Myxococcota bacterium]